MSYTAEVIICVTADKDVETVTSLSFDLLGPRFARHGSNAERTGALLPLEDEMGGHKAPATRLWGGVLNHADIPALLDHLATENWSEPDSLQVLVKTEDDSWFQLYMLRDGSFKAFAPDPST